MLYSCNVFYQKKYLCYVLARCRVDRWQLRDTSSKLYRRRKESLFFSPNQSSLSLTQHTQHPFPCLSTTTPPATIQASAIYQSCPSLKVNFDFPSSIPFFFCFDALKLSSTKTSQFGIFLGFCFWVLLLCPPFSLNLCVQLVPRKNGLVMKNKKGGFLFWLYGHPILNYLLQFLGLWFSWLIFKRICK